MNGERNLERGEWKIENKKRILAIPIPIKFRYQKPQVLLFLMN
jgi:hypothetical protein